jgi:hypothetical protein
LSPAKKRPRKHERRNHRGQGKGGTEERNLTTEITEKAERKNQINTIIVQD